MHERRQSHVAKTYKKWEIGGQSQAFANDKEQTETADESLIKVRATCGSTKPSDTFFAHLMTIEKAGHIQQRIESLVE